MGEIIYAFVTTGLQVYSFMMLYSVVSSWVPALKENPVGRIVETAVEPYFNIFRRFIPPIGMIDISPIFAFLVFRFARDYLLQGLAIVLNLLGLM